MREMQDIEREGYILMSLYMNSVNYEKLCEWANQRFNLIADETYKYVTPRYRNTPIITDEGVPDDEVWITKSRIPLEADIVEL